VLRDAPRSAFEIVLEKRVTVTQAGIDQELSVEQALQLRTYQDALAGKRAARREVLKMIAKREKAMADREVNPANEAIGPGEDVTGPKKRRRRHVSSRHCRAQQKPRGV